MRLSALFVIVFAVGCDRSESGRSVEVGHIHSGSLPDDEYNALKLEVEHLNKDTSQLPQARRLVVRHAPGGSGSDEWGAQATRLLSLNHVIGLVGGSRWEEAEKIGAAIQSEKAIAIVPAGWAGPTPASKLFCVGIAPSERGRVLAIAAKEAKPKQIVVLRDNAARAACLAADEFVRNCRDANVSVCEIDVASAKKFDADLVFFACSAGQALKLRDLAINQPHFFFGDEDAQLPQLLAAGKDADRFVVATACDPAAKSDRLTAFTTRYQEAYKQAPSLPAALAHDAFTIWVEAAKRAAGYETAAMRAELLKRDAPFDSLTGPLTFADDHTARRAIFVAKLANGALTEIRTFEPSPAK